MFHFGLFIYTLGLVMLCYTYENLLLQKLNTPYAQSIKDEATSCGREVQGKNTIRPCIYSTLH